MEKRRRQPKTTNNLLLVVTRRSKQEEALGTRCRTENSDCRGPNKKLADWEASWKSSIAGIKIGIHALHIPD